MATVSLTGILYLTNALTSVFVHFESSTTVNFGLAYVVTHLIYAVLVSFARGWRAAFINICRDEL